VPRTPALRHGRTRSLCRRATQATSRRPGRSSRKRRGLTLGAARKSSAYPRRPLGPIAHHGAKLRARPRPTTPSRPGTTRPFVSSGPTKRASGTTHAPSGFAGLPRERGDSPSPCWGSPGARLAATTPRRVGGDFPACGEYPRRPAPREGARLAPTTLRRRILVRRLFGRSDREDHGSGPRGVRATDPESDVRHVLFLDG
jgi:hypothetical protein